MGSLMAFASDILFIAGAIGLGFYCFVLSRRLSRFTDLEKGVGGAVAVLSVQVDDLTRTLKTAREAAGESGDRLQALTARAEETARSLELHLAAMHDLPAARPTAPDSAATPASTAASLQPATVGPVDAAPSATPVPPEVASVQHAPSGAPPVQSFFASHRRPVAEARQ